MTRIDETVQQAPVWDPVVRLTHWLVALSIVINGLITEGGAIHNWVGYAALAIVVLRLIWGLIGTESARFTSFPPSLSAARRHLDDMMHWRHRPRRSHNPLGALMVYSLWTLLVVASLTGIALDGASPSWSGEDGILSAVHALSGNLMVLLAALHIAGVAVETRISGRSLVRPMIRPSPPGRNED